MAYPQRPSRSNTSNVAYFEVEHEEPDTPPQPPLPYQNPYPPQHYNRTPPPQHYNRTPPPQHYNRTPPPPIPQYYNGTPPPQHGTPPPQHYNRTPPPQHFNRTPSPHPPNPYNQGPVDYNNNAPYPSRTPPPQYLPPIPPVPTPPPQQPPYNNPGYSTATYNGSSSYLTQPYPRPSTSPQQQYQQNLVHPSAPPVRKESPSVETSRPEMYRTGGGPAPPRAENYSSPRPAAVPTSIVATPTYGGGSGKIRGSSPRRHHHNDDTDLADCCSVCGCIRCSCTLFMIVLGLAFIIGGLALFAYSRALPGKCGGLCDPNANNGTLVGGTDGHNSTVLTNAAGAVNNGTQGATNTCTSLCSKGVYNGLHYSGIALLCIGIMMLVIQVFNMICRVGKSGGRGSGCCFCC